MSTSGGIEPSPRDETITSWEEQFYPADVDAGRSLGKRTLVPWEDDLAAANVVVIDAGRSRGDEAIAVWEDEFSAGIPPRRKRK